MTPDELKEAVRRTKDEIYHLKAQLETAIDPRERKALQRRLKEVKTVSSMLTVKR